MRTNRGGQSLEQAKREGFALRTHQGSSAPLDPSAKGEAPSNLSIGMGVGGGLTVTYQGLRKPSSHTHPNEWFQGPLPLVEVQEAKPPGRGPGRKPRRLPGAGLPRVHCCDS